MSRVLHLSLDVRGAIEARACYPRLVPGRRVTDRRSWLLDRLAEGKRVLSVNELLGGVACDGFSHETGCPGHEGA